MKRVIFAFLFLSSLSFGLSALAMPWGPAPAGEPAPGFQHRGGERGGERGGPRIDHDHFTGPRGGFQPHHGFAPGRRYYGYGFNPGWYHEGWGRGLRFGPFAFVIGVPVGYWQCTAFSGFNSAVSDIGATQEQAAYDALYQCGGENFEAAGCYIPDGYCRIR